MANGSLSTKCPTFIIAHLWSENTTMTWTPWQPLPKP
jgi:hypothetical protein